MYWQQRSHGENFRKWDFNSTEGGAFKTPELSNNGTAASGVVSFSLLGMVKDSWIQRQNEVNENALEQSNLLLIQPLPL